MRANNDVVQYISGEKWGKQRKTETLEGVHLEVTSHGWICILNYHLIWEKFRVSQEMFIRNFILIRSYPLLLPDKTIILLGICRNVNGNMLQLCPT